MENSHLQSDYFAFAYWQTVHRMPVQARRFLCFLSLSACA